MKHYNHPEHGYLIADSKPRGEGWEEVDSRPSPDHIRVDGEWVLDQDRLWDRVRAERQPLLDEADWRICRAEDENADTIQLRAYRQALRDVTDQENPEAVVWPLKPWE